ncbi:uncharacterized protein [Palaemon carinicauda]|uniref:uncharacterized protein n=1 Tax=Palaemon carinicauda TaxID=392227 RepID=UPI0035B60065
MPHEPWKGEFFERLNGVTKHVLQIALGKKYLPDAHVLTLLKEAEAVVNNRPLMYSGDRCEDEVLTPSHLVRGRMINLMALNLPDDHLNATFTSRRLRDCYLKLTDSLKVFRERWRKEYLRALRARNDCRSGEPSKLHPGDGKLVKQDNKKRATWPLRHVVETYPDDDEVVRSAKVLFEDVESLRAVSHLLPWKLPPLMTMMVLEKTMATSRTRVRIVCQQDCQGPLRRLGTTRRWFRLRHLDNQPQRS